VARDCLAVLVGNSRALWRPVPRGLLWGHPGERYSCRVRSLEQKSSVGALRTGGGAGEQPMLLPLPLYSTDRGMYACMTTLTLYCSLGGCCGRWVRPGRASEHPVRLYIQTAVAAAAREVAALLEGPWTAAGEEGAAGELRGESGRGSEHSVWVGQRGRVYRGACTGPMRHSLASSSRSAHGLHSRYIILPEQTYSVRCTFLGRTLYIVHQTQACRNSTHGLHSRYCNIHPTLQNTT